MQLDFSTVHERDFRFASVKHKAIVSMSECSEEIAKLSAPSDLTSGSCVFNSDGYAEDNRITMFAQRKDGSVKPAGEITGGFVTDTVRKGNLYRNKSLMNSIS